MWTKVLELQPNAILPSEITAVEEKFIVGIFYFNFLAGVYRTNDLLGLY